ncbi:unnamed protein product [Bursaphelenchus okinawaensis]|uniref:Uncharacterized protein n=1 Tax=Bursaphelenchus okinawaensis TaxID=465554 RepID=A0A811LLT6_9BILA|nr:unnamed protein product [Bursaphelenchus okinawaensis]CAG9127834.1 unnamed protein product [Bursaphelenchus okinawaensis]
MFKIFVLCFVVVAVSAQERGIKKSKRVAYAGKLTCDGGGLHTIDPVEVRLYEKHFGKHAVVNKDRLLSSVKASPDGQYQIGGIGKYIVDLHTYLEVYHTCGGACRKIELTSEKNVSSVELLNKGSDCKQA